MNLDYSLALIDGAPVAPNDLAGLAFAGFAHFTAMQVRDGGIRGLDLHLGRLTAASRVLFGVDLVEAEVRSHLRAALDRLPVDCSVTITVFSAAGEFSDAGPSPSLHTLIRIAPPSSGPAGPLSLALVDHERFMAGIKHVGEGAKTFYLRQAVRSGFDDAAFVDRDGRITEASIWNLAFWDGKSVVWPTGDKLKGTMMGTVQRRLEQMGVPQRSQDIHLVDTGNLSAVVMNSWSPAIPVSQLGEKVLTSNPHFVRLLHEAYQSAPLVRP
ncbi:aminotransferase class IV family protein [Arthrobacter sp. TMN-49]